MNTCYICYNKTNLYSFVYVFCSQSLILTVNEMDRNFCLKPSSDTRKKYSDVLFLSRIYTEELDPIHDGLCGYRAVARELHVSLKHVVEALCAFALEFQDDARVVAAQERWHLVSRHVEQGKGVDRSGWLISRIDCKFINNLSYYHCYLCILFIIIVTVICLV